ncbi:two-component system histidine kinase PnpS [Fonticella tunisiensis]|uniref:histidine kinase n=1 Tax=Fonticella tunisiensis TaxID=1096341 RepID=A0A4R7KU72_9CLOT|nr:ATP-binding protein [Fonticella tunisiensis]TDT61844.1 PAS/PAC sensor signal transduction histidine kinase [Fonticella tunisiensis]
MRKKLFIFFVLVLLLGVSSTGFLAYNVTKSLLLANIKSNLKSESKLAVDYIKANGKKESFDAMAKEIKNKTGKRTTIIAYDGRVLGDSDSLVQSMKNHLNRPEIHQAWEKGEGTSVRLSETENKTMYYYALKFPFDGEEYILRLSVAFDDIKKLQFRYMNFVIITVIIGGILSSIFVYIYLDIFIRPIRELIRLATIIALGQYEKRVKINSRDEIGQLGHAFNLMAGRLQETILDLSDKRNKLISILTSMDDGVVVLDENEKILIINPSARKLFDIKGDVTGKYFIEVVRNHDMEKLIKIIPDEDVEININYPSHRILRVKSKRIINYDNHFGNLGVLLVIQDVTKIKMLEKMRSDFVANVSHELKTPLTSIKGFAETLMYVEDKATKEKFLNIINIEAERLTRLINDILILSELENRDVSINFEKINIKKSIEEVYYIMLPLARDKNIELKFNQPDNDVFISGDRDKFKQMMINLVDNAIKYTNNGGTVDIKFKEEDESIKIYVSDNGIGIPEEHLPRLFERFYRVDKARSRRLGGTGLGLAIVKHVVMLFNGKIDVKSKPGKGTTFIITLPLLKK